MEQKRTEVREYVMPDILKKYNVAEPTEEELEHDGSMYGLPYKRKLKLTPEQKRQRALDNKREIFAKYHKKSGSDFYDH